MRRVGTKWFGPRCPGEVIAVKERMMIDPNDKPDEAEQADEMEKVQEDAAEERENEGGYQ